MNGLILAVPMPADGPNSPVSRHGDTWAQRIRHGARANTFVRHLLLGLAWLALWRISALMEFAPHASIWFPPAGLSLAALLVMGWRAVPMLMICAVISSFWGTHLYPAPLPMRDVLLAGISFGVAHCASYGTGAAVLRHVARRASMQSLPVIIVAFLAVGSLSALAAALTGVRSLQLSGILSPTSADDVWLPWWIGDMAGALVLTPMFLGLLGRSYPTIQSWFGGLDFRPRQQPVGAYAIKLLVCVLLLSAIMLAAARFQHREIAFSAFFLIIPQMWIVYTESPFRSAVSLAIFSTAMALWTAELELVQEALVYQFAICVIAASSYFGLAVPVLLARNKQLSELAFSDGLTKVTSKEHFFERSAQELLETRRFGLPASLIVLDIDHFKDINDNYGHAVGDQALVKLVMTVKMHLRQSDVIGRFGGDEFMLLLPGVDHAQAVATAERLRLVLQDCVAPGTERCLQTSFGVVGIGPDEPVMRAFERADALLLNAKRSGRNSVGLSCDDARPGAALGT